MECVPLGGNGWHWLKFEIQALEAEMHELTDEQQLHAERQKRKEMALAEALEEAAARHSGVHRDHAAAITRSSLPRHVPPPPPRAMFDPPPALCLGGTRMECVPLSGWANGAAAAASLNNRKEWAMREDQLIWRGVQQIGCKWQQIAAMLPGRSDDAVRNRYNRLKEAEASGLVRSDSGEPTEAHAAGTPSGGGGGGTGTYRCSKCGQLKKNHMCTAVATGDARPKSDDKRVGWTKAEDAIITHSVQELGHRWYQIAERLPGRTDHAIRNRWHRLLTMRQEEEARAQAGGRSAAPGSAPIAMPGMDADAATDGAGVSMANEGEVEVLPLAPA